MHFLLEKEIGKTAILKNYTETLRSILNSVSSFAQVFHFLCYFSTAMEMFLLFIFFHDFLEF